MQQPWRISRWTTLGPRWGSLVHGRTERKEEKRTDRSDAYPARIAQRQGRDGYEQPTPWTRAGRRDILMRMIHGAHVIIYSTDPEADRVFFRDVLKYESVDAGHGFLIFALPPAEVAVHPSDKNDVHELFLMCDDVQALIAEMKKKKVGCSAVDEQRWGSITRLTLPGDGKLGIYQPKHPSPLKVRAT